LAARQKDFGADAIKIDGLAAQLCGKTQPSRRNPGAEVLAMLERACAGELVD